MSRKSYRRHTRRTRSRKHRGGAGAPDPSSYSSASTYGMAVNGTGDSQYNRVFSQTGPDANSQSNAIMGLQGQKAGKRMRRGGAPTLAELAFAPRRGGSKKRRGGFIGEVVNQAIVPFGILGMQQTYRKTRGSRKNMTRRNRRR